MTMPRNRLDHLVVAAQTLAQGEAYVHQCLGVRPVGGGRHEAMGTHNRVLKLDGRRYLEVIAIDPAGERPALPRWFHLDDPAMQAAVTSKPRLVAWVVSTDAVDGLAASVYDGETIIRPMRRNDLRWRFAFTADGSIPFNGAVPYLIQWDSHHPADSMDGCGCELIKLTITTTEPLSVRQVLYSLKLDLAVEILPASAACPAGLTALLRTPTGDVRLT